MLPDVTFNLYLSICLYVISVSVSICVWLFLSVLFLAKYVYFTGEIDIYGFFDMVPMDCLSVFPFPISLYLQYLHLSHFLTNSVFPSLSLLLSISASLSLQFYLSVPNPLHLSISLSLSHTLSICVV